MSELGHPPVFMLEEYNAVLKCEFPYLYAVKSGRPDILV